MKYAIVLLAAASLAAQTHWVGTWGAAPAPQSDDAAMVTQKLVFNNQTLREIVHTSIGGDTVRVRLSNAFGSVPVGIGAAHIALRGEGSAIKAGTDHALTFGGRPAVEIPAGAVILSDAVKLTIPELSDVAISLFIPGKATGAGVHYSSQQTSYASSGNASAAAKLENPTTFTSWAFLTGLEVTAPQATGSIVTFGDSITDGARSTVDGNHRWPDTLAARLAARKGAVKLGVVNMGIGGNRILHEGIASKRPQFGINALARFDYDVLAQPGVKYVMILEGINDIGHAGSSAPASEAVTAEDIIAGMKQMIDRAHEHGIKVIGATLTPFEGPANVQRGYWSAEKAKVREAVNEWIRTGKAFDGIVDFDKVVRDPAHPTHILPAFDSGDQLHPSDAGYDAMGKAIDLAIFR
ncbi:MAG: putative GDSL-like lipase/acylhydrolase [Bryobacterales bacterium]|nr:putative GDSL-like lipase/acylhydrolase [Bryobacterales bacterium]